MRPTYFHFALFALFFSNFGWSQEDSLPFIDQSFLIISSSKAYDAAFKTALEADDKLGFNFVVSNYYPDSLVGFRTDEVCTCGEIHDYFPRGSYDDGNYISIEFSSAYEGFSEGYYIVIVASGNRQCVENELSRVKEHYAQAYIKNAEIYVGCLH